jgi:hypothetical protein
MAESSSTYNYIVDKYKDKLRTRAEWLYSIAESYLDVTNLQGKVAISKEILEHVLIDYFVDIDRLKEFADIEHVNDVKIYAYMSYWILKHKPLQIVNVDECNDCVFVNEKFVSHLLRSLLFTEPENVVLLNNKIADVDAFISTLEYYFKYRNYTAQSIELAILAFVAGRGYQYSADFQN